MAERLIEDMAEKWNPETYRDEYRDDLMRLIEKKVRAGETHVIEERRPRRRESAATSVVDLMPLLKQSLARRERGEPAKGRPERRGPRRARSADSRAKRPGRTGRKRSA